MRGNKIRYIETGVRLRTFLLGGLQGRERGSVKLLLLVASGTLYLF